MSTFQYNNVKMQDCIKLKVDKLKGKVEMNVLINSFTKSVT